MKSSTPIVLVGFNAHPIQTRIAAARELVSSIPTLTLAGQRFAMERILALLSDDDRRSLAQSLGPQHPWFQAHMDRLNREAIRQAPDVDAFRAGAESLIDGLALAL